ncbi:PEP-CTERM sorting domain-containing protein [Desulfonatronovibrio hydrogenovorans]|uniref:PEP-CTERM sorting domain-containing protein n=1 Tax=Desulfonatronovibrio hydrogenovorans TaxID=53245 RepID=UPI00049181B1|nr:PEP-CTERM sorting domain-containing protein [Desulfonatronovibrio hydrogenovorans]
MKRIFFISIPILFLALGLSYLFADPYHAKEGNRFQNSQKSDPGEDSSLGKVLRDKLADLKQLASPPARPGNNYSNEIGVDSDPQALAAPAYSGRFQIQDRQTLDSGQERPTPGRDLALGAATNPGFLAGLDPLTQSVSGSQGKSSSGSAGSFGSTPGSKQSNPDPGNMDFDSGDITDLQSLSPDSGFSSDPTSHGPSISTGSSGSSGTTDNNSGSNPGHSGNPNLPGDDFLGDLSDLFPGFDLDDPLPCDFGDCLTPNENEINHATTPEPGTMILLGTGILAFILFGRRFGTYAN